MIYQKDKWSLLVGSGGLCSHIVREAQLILKAMKKKGFKEERLTKVELYAINKFTSLESNKSLVSNFPGAA